MTNAKLSVEIDLAGGSICSITRPGGGPNPLSFGYLPTEDATQVGPAAMGHFVCCDRGGPASEAEQLVGAGWHGEASKVQWVLQHGTATSATMVAALPTARLALARKIALVPGQPVLLVEETIANAAPLGRAYNLVQHPSIGPPFLSVATVVDANASIGFRQQPRVAAEVDCVDPPPADFPAVGSFEQFEFPSGPPSSVAAGLCSLAQLPTLLRGMQGAGADEVSSFVLEKGAPRGWVTALNPGANGEVFGYIWPAVDYPW
eukprot:SAG31_NODE_10983_length_1076_cov_0.784033_1_plen_260_part_01